jgi:transcriptional antiterminator
MISVDGEELKTNKFIEMIARTEEKTDYRIKLKAKELYNKELAKVIKKLLKKYHEYIELFVKREY